MVGTNLIQMILSIDPPNRNTHGVSWLPLYHDMGLSMTSPSAYGGHSHLLSPTAFVRHAALDPGVVGWFCRLGDHRRAELSPTP